MGSKWSFMWVAGVGFTAMQVFLLLQSTWARVGLGLLFLGCFAVLVKIPKEMQIPYWIVLTLIFTVWYYILKPINIDIMGML